MRLAGSAYLSLWALAICWLTLACAPKEAEQVEEVVTTSSTVSIIEEPEEFAGILYPAWNPTTEAGLALGERLFFDPILSADSTVSCSTCHLPELAFTDGKAVSVGIRGRRGQRSSPTLTNIGYNHLQMFWDGRSSSLEEQAIHPIADPKEMGSNWPVLVHQLRHHPYYRQALVRAFELDGVGEINPDHIARALAQYQRSLISSNSRYDQMVRNEIAFSPLERRGWAIFFDRAEDPEGTYAGLPTGECAHCHSAPHFSNQQFFNNGIDAAPTLTEFADLGLGGISKNVYENGLFKVPSLRNIALTAPYMHDGRFNSLEEVIDHYNSGGHYASNKSPNIRPLGLSATDKEALIAFLHSLSDSEFLDEQVQRSLPFRSSVSAQAIDEQATK